MMHKLCCLSPFFISLCALGTSDGHTNTIFFYVFLFPHLRLNKFNIGKSSSDIMTSLKCLKHAVNRLKGANTFHSSVFLGADMFPVAQISRQCWLRMKCDTNSTHSGSCGRTAIKEATTTVPSPPTHLFCEGTQIFFFVIRFPPPSLISICFKETVFLNLL